MGIYKISDAVRRGVLSKYSKNTASLIESYFGAELPDCTSQVGQCIDFNGVDQYVVFGGISDSDTRFNGAKYLTFGGLFYHRGSAGGQRIITHSTALPLYLDIRSNDKLTVSFATSFNGGESTVTASVDLNGGSLTRNAWHDLRIVVDCITQKLMCFIDGALTDETWPASWGTTYKDHSIYCSGNAAPRLGSSTGAQYFYNGFMSMLYLTPEALDSSAHCAIVYGGQKRTPNTNGWVMPLNEANPTVVGTNQWRLFEGGGVHVGTLYNTSPTGTSFINGRFATRGVKQPNRMGVSTIFGYPEQWGNILLPTPTIGADDFSVSFWAKTPSTTANNVNFMLNTFGDSGNFLRVYTAKSAQTLRVSYSIGGILAVIILPGFTPDVWHNVALTFDRDHNLIIYLDGVNIHEENISDIDLSLLSQAWYLGAPPTQSNTTNGMLLNGLCWSTNTLWSEDQVNSILNLLKRF